MVYLFSRCMCEAPALDLPTLLQLFLLLPQLLHVIP
jgi:hypothetical protein